MCSSTCSKADGKGQGKEGEGGQQQDKEKVEVGNLVEWGDWEAFEPRSAFVPEMIMRITRTMKISMLIKMAITNVTTTMARVCLGTCKHAQPTKQPSLPAWSSCRAASLAPWFT